MQAIYCILIICSHDRDLTLLGAMCICEIAMPQRSLFQKIFPGEPQSTENDPLKRYGLVIT